MNTPKEGISGNLGEHQGLENSAQSLTFWHTGWSRSRGPLGSSLPADKNPHAELRAKPGPSTVPPDRSSRPISHHRMQQAAISPSDTGDHIHWLAELAPRAISPATGRNSRP